MIYSTLETSRREIRLLELKYINSNEVLHCVLNTASLHTDLTFTALSYCWGDETQRCRINIDGQDATITKNLGLALKYLWNQRDGVLVWVDAVCINQENNTERSEQVRIMGEIYAKGFYGLTCI